MPPGLGLGEVGGELLDVWVRWCGAGERGGGWALLVLVRRGRLFGVFGGMFGGVFGGYGCFHSGAGGHCWVRIVGSGWVSWRFVGCGYVGAWVVCRYVVDRCVLCYSSSSWLF